MSQLIVNFTSTIQKRQNVMELEVKPQYKKGKFPECFFINDKRIFNTFEDSFVLKKIHNDPFLNTHKNYEAVSYWPLRKAIVYFNAYINGKDTKRKILTLSKKPAKHRKKFIMFLDNYKKNEGTCRCSICGEEAKYIGIYKETLVKVDNVQMFGVRNGVPLFFNIDHIIPSSKGGSDHPSNYQLTCVDCNEGKGNKLPEVKMRQIELEKTEMKDEPEIEFEFIKPTEPKVAKEEFFTLRVNKENLLNNINFYLWSSFIVSCSYLLSSIYGAFAAAQFMEHAKGHLLLVSIFSFTTSMSSILLLILQLYRNENHKKN